MTYTVHWIIFIVALRRLRVSENRVLRRIFGTRRDEVTGKWRRDCIMRNLMFNVLLTCIVIYPYNMNQLDALFIFNLFP
jgi:hypothetical protein